MKKRYIRYVLSFIFVLLFIDIFAQQPELVIQNGHNDEIRSVDISPDGQHFLTGGWDNYAILWDLQGHELLRLKEESRITVACFSPDGQQILTGGFDNRIILWDLAGGEKASFYVDNMFVNAACFSPDGKRVLTGGFEKVAKLWDLEGNLIQVFDKHQDQITAVDYSRQNNLIVTGSADKKVIFWSVKGEVLRVLEDHESPIFSVSISPDGDKIVTGDSDGVIKLWNADGLLLSSFQAHGAWVSTLSFNADGSRVLSGSVERTAKIWTTQGDLIRTFTGHQQGVESAKFFPNGKYILTGSLDHTAILWDTSGRIVNRYGGKKPEILSASFAKDVKQFAIGNNTGQITHWDLERGQINQFQTDLLSISELYLSKNGNRIIASEYNSDGGIWTKEGKKIKTYDSSSYCTEAILSSDDEQLHFIINRDEILVKDYSGKTIKAIATSPALLAGDCSSAERKVVTGDSTGIVIIWDLDSNTADTINNNLVGDTGYEDIKAVKFSHDGQKVLVANLDGIVRLWDATGAKELLAQFETKTYSPALSFSPDGQQVIAGDQQGNLELRSIEGQLIHRLIGHTNWIHAIHFLSDSCLLTASRDGTIRAWNVTTGALLTTHYVFNDKNSEWVIVNSDNYYTGTKKIHDLVHFRIGAQVYNFDQFDLRLNRPDRVLEAQLHYMKDASLLNVYQDAYYKRLEKYGFTEDMLTDDYHVPECTIRDVEQLPLVTREPSVRLNISASDTLQLLDRLQVYVNDVPIYGVSGINLRDYNIGQYAVTLNIPLSQGENKIQVSALNQGGAESLKATTYITYDAPAADPDLYLIAIGTSDYATPGKNLRYAAEDARDIALLYQSAKGFAQIYTKTLTDQQVTKANILALRTWLEQSRVDDQILLYVSGHGLIDDNYDFYYATHDIDFANPAEKGILYDDIEGLLDGIPARKKLLLMDACHSGEYDADAPPLTSIQLDSLAQKGVSFKGFSKGEGESGPTLGLQNSFELMQQLFADLRRGSGATVITSSAGVQVSFEDGQWQNGAFTYAFLYGLKSMKADANRDGQVTASEIQAFVAEYVPRLTEGLQVPTFRRENLEYDFRVW